MVRTCQRGTRQGLQRRSHVGVSRPRGRCRGGGATTPIRGCQGHPGSLNHSTGQFLGALMPDHRWRFSNPTLLTSMEDEFMNYHEFAVVRTRLTLPNPLFSDMRALVEAMPREAATPFRCLSGGEMIAYFTRLSVSGARDPARSSSPFTNTRHSTHTASIRSTIRVSGPTSAFRQPTGCQTIRCACTTPSRRLRSGGRTITDLRC